MKRRELLAILGGAAFALPVAARAQQKAMPVIGYLASTSPRSEAFTQTVAAFRRGLNEAGYVEGQNIAIEFRFAEGRFERLPDLAAELVGRKVDLILASGGTTAALVAKKATSSIPIVFYSGDDPVSRGLVESLARPGGNLTGITNFEVMLTAKRIELLSELVPRTRTVALISNPNNVNSENIIQGAREAALAKGMRLHVLHAGNEAEIDAAYIGLAELRADALVIGTDPFLISRREQLAALSARHAVPAIYGVGDFAAVGGLITYAPSLAGAFRQMGLYSARILKGAKPADLPVEQPTKFELVINLKTAAALGLTVPQALLARADEVIE